MTIVNEFNDANKGDLPFIEQICSATWEPLYRFIYFKVQNREEAEDITQETYVKTLTYLQDHKNPGENPLGFLKTVAMNILRDRWRQKRRRGISANIEEINPQEIAEVDDQMALIQRMQLESDVRKLSEDHRAVLDLRIMKGYSAAETARLLGKTEAAVRTSQYRALQALAQIIDRND